MLTIYMNSYPQWNQEQQQSGHTTPSTPFSPGSSIPPGAYSNEVQRLHTVQDHRLPEQIESLSPHFYSPTASSSAQFGPNLLPIRHTELPHPVRQPFEASYGNSISPPPWSSTEPTYGAALHLVPQQSPSQNYNFASEAYVDSRYDTQNIAWSATG